MPESYTEAVAYDIPRMTFRGLGENPRDAGILYGRTLRMTFRGLGENPRDAGILYRRMTFRGGENPRDAGILYGRTLRMGVWGKIPEMPESYTEG